MNQIEAYITKIESVDNITIVSFKVGAQCMKMMALEIHENVAVGSLVILGAKATNIALSKEHLEHISISNQLEAVIESIVWGILLCSVRFMFEGVCWESIITRDSATRMELKVGEKVIALLKSSELSIIKVDI